MVIIGTSRGRIDNGAPSWQSIKEGKEGGGGGINEIGQGGGGNQ